VSLRSPGSERDWPNFTVATRGRHKCRPSYLLRLSLDTTDATSTGANNISATEAIVVAFSVSLGKSVMLHQ
jgi:hypothetical protein